MKNVLLHICCGPCLIYPLDALRTENMYVHGFFYNPNIHPYTEFKKRLECLETYCANEDLKLTSEVGYDLEEFMRKVVGHEDDRCPICYEMRLRKTAQAAKDAGFDFFTTTLLYSKYQKHELLVQVANVVATEIGIQFLYRDFRAGWQNGQDRSRELGLYRQGYCGCMYSEMERYKKDIARLSEERKGEASPPEP